jgi:DNA invertase Pin-like site-specific DNA recombinase
MPRAAIYARVSTPEQCLENQLYDLREMASRRGYEVVHEYTDIGSGSKARREGLDALPATHAGFPFSQIPRVTKGQP